MIRRERDRKENNYIRGGERRIKKGKSRGRGKKDREREKEQGKGKEG